MRLALLPRDLGQLITSHLHRVERYILSLSCEELRWCWSEEKDVISPKKVAYFAAKMSYHSIVEWSVTLGATAMRRLSVMVAREGTPEMLSRLFQKKGRHYPDCIIAAIDGDNIRCLGWLEDNSPHFDLPTVVRQAIKKGKIKTVKRYFDKEMFVRDEFGHAIIHGHREVVKYLYKFRLPPSTILKPLTLNGDLEMIKLVMKKQKTGLIPWVMMCENCCKKGHLNVLKWLEKKGKFNGGDKYAKIALDEGHLELVYWLHTTFGNSYHDSVNSSIFHKMLQQKIDFSSPRSHAIALKYQWEDVGISRIMPYVIKHGNIDDFDSIMNECREVMDRSCIELVFVQRHDLRPWLRDSGLISSSREYLFLPLAMRGDVDDLKWLDKEGLLDQSCVEQVNHIIPRVSLKMTKYLVKRFSSDVNTLDPYQIVSRMTDVDKVKWLLRRCDGVDFKVLSDKIWNMKHVDDRIKRFIDKRIEVRPSCSRDDSATKSEEIGWTCVVS